MEIGETKGERALEFGSFAEDRTQLAFDLATVEALGEATSFKASSGSTGPLLTLACNGAGMGTIDNFGVL